MDVRWPPFLSAVQINEAVAREIVVLPQKWADFRDPLFDSRLENVVDCFGRTKIPKQDCLADDGPVSSSESADIALGKKNFVVIQILEIGHQYSLRHFGPEFPSAVVAHLHQTGYFGSNLPGVSDV